MLDESRRRRNAWLAGLVQDHDEDAGAHLLVIALAAGVALVLARDGIGRHARLALPVAAGLTFWILLTASRGYDNLPYESHYAYAGAVLLLMLGSELAAGLRIPAGTR